MNVPELNSQIFNDIYESHHFLCYMKISKSCHAHGPCNGLYYECLNCDLCFKIHAGYHFKPEIFYNIKTMLHDTINNSNMARVRKIFEYCNNNDTNLWNLLR